MACYQVNKTFQEINEKIRSGKAVVVTAEEMIGIVRSYGEVEAARRVDVVTTGTFSPMCSSGAFINFGHSVPGIKASKVWLNGVPAYAGLAAVDIYIGATEPVEDDPLNKVYPGEFLYGGGHVIHDLVAGKAVQLKAEAYGTHCYPRQRLEKRVTLKDLPFAQLCNPRNAYQNYNCAVNVTNKTIYTYMGTLRPNLGNANYCTSGQLSPLFNDPHYRTIGIGTRIFLGGGIGYVVSAGTQHKPNVEYNEKGLPKRPAGTLMVLGDLKNMNNKWLVGVSILGYGCSLAVGLGIPIPILNEEMAFRTGVSDEDIVTQVIDYGKDYPEGKATPLGEVSYAQLKSGSIVIGGKEIPTSPLSSYVKAKEIAEILKTWIKQGSFLLGEPQELLPSAF
ncbi:MAG: homocysteine biosynthesis protein [Dissulfurimicrobium sp.]|uniref:homocysteine biosynthesis protein n=1 Tax=Dissulfurimicrobium TaxID=1769732 RepID=UPI001ED9F7AB|nr:homocysteine biosynthesis protein [Dissulfurimicrobium hydrothermale]UKL13270.1 homocysteine biosynthesis protein [Dissulfurimicrobium hydrothermale]